jgi:hypothetical protein
MKLELGRQSHEFISMKRLCLVLSLICLSTILSGYEYSLDLTGGYKLTRIEQKDRPIIQVYSFEKGKGSHGYVENVAVKPPYIAGHATNGFFLLDTGNDEMREGLTDQQWRTELANIAWNNPLLIDVLVTEKIAGWILLGALIALAVLIILIRISRNRRNKSMPLSENPT